MGRGAEGERDKQTPCWAWSPIWGSIPGPWNHDLNQNQESDAQLTKPPRNSWKILKKTKKILFIYSWETQREREAETLTGGEAGSMQEAQCGTRSRVPRIRSRAEGSAKPLSHQGFPSQGFSTSIFSPPRTPISIFLFSITLEVLASALRQEKNKDWKGRNKTIPVCRSHDKPRNLIF